MPSLEETNLISYGDFSLKGEAPQYRDMIKGLRHQRTVPLMGQELADIGTSYQDFNLLDLEEGKTFPGFPLGGPSVPSVNMGLNEMRLSEPKYADERANTFQHELMHAGVRHPRFKEFLESGEFKNLHADYKDMFFKVMSSDHDYIEPMARYQEKYQNAVDEKIVPNLFLQTEYLLSPQALNEGIDKKDQAIFRKMLQAKEDGRDPVHVFVMNRYIRDEDFVRLSDIEEISAIFGNYLNKTADINTGKTTGNRYYPVAEKMRREKEIAQAKFLEEEALLAK